MIRKSKLDDLHSIEECYFAARKYMADENNPQWGDNHPLISETEKDIRSGASYVLVDESDEIYGTFSLFYEPDSTYKVIMEGEWLNDEPYVVIHKLASKGTHHGVFDEVIEFASKSGRDIRIDTHEKNLTMKHLLEKRGFTYCGVIELIDGQKRIAFQRKK